MKANVKNGLIIWDYNLIVIRVKLEKVKKYDTINTSLNISLHFSKALFKSLSSSAAWGIRSGCDITLSVPKLFSLVKFFPFWKIKEELFLVCLPANSPRLKAPLRRGFRTDLDLCGSVLHHVFRRSFGQVPTWVLHRKPRFDNVGVCGVLLKVKFRE